MLSKNSTDSKKGKSMSIKNRVSIFYSLVLVLFCISLIVVFFNVVENQSDSVTKKNLAEAVYEAFADIDGDSTTVEVNSDFDKYSKGVTLVLYDEDGNLLLGSTPSKFPASTPLELASYNNVTVDQENWLIFDANETYKNGQTIWVRGIYALDSNASLISAIMLVLLIILPILLAVAIIIGRRITVKAFDPMIDIIESADKIEIGNDVKGRISLPVRKDELYDLSLTLNNMLGRLEAAFEGERQFSSDVTHELKTPLSVILAQCEFILNEPRSSEEYVAAITQIQIDCKRILALSTQLLNISRTINKNELIEKEEINLSVLCESIGEQMEISALEKNIKVECDIEDNVIVTADETLMLRMIMNLMSNSIKYTDPKGHIKLTLKSGSNSESNISDLEVKSGSYGQFILSVKDDGIGIGAEHIDKIFNRFYKVDQSREYQGADNSFGLGLSMVKWIADAHGYKINLTSQVGIGTEFIITNI